MSRQKPNALRTLKVPAIALSESRNTILKTASSKSSPRNSPQRTHNSNGKLSARVKDNKYIAEEAKQQCASYSSNKSRLPKPKLSSPQRGREVAKQKATRTSLVPKEVKPLKAPKKIEGKSTDLNKAEMQILKSSMMMENKSCENIRVGIRVRPLTQEEKTNKIQEAWGRSHDGKLLDKKKGIIYIFGMLCITKLDKVYWYEYNNKDVFTGTAQPLIISAMEGYNGK